MTPRETRDALNVQTDNFSICYIIHVTIEKRDSEYKLLGRSGSMDPRTDGGFVLGSTLLKALNMLMFLSFLFLLQIICNAVMIPQELHPRTSPRFLNRKVHPYLLMLDSHQGRTRSSRANLSMLEMQAGSPSDADIMAALENTLGH